MRPAVSSSFTWCERVAAEMGRAERACEQPSGQPALAICCHSSNRCGSASALKMAVCWARVKRAVFALRIASVDGLRKVDFIFKPRAFDDMVSQIDCEPDAGPARENADGRRYGEPGRGLVSPNLAVYFLGPLYSSHRMGWGVGNGRDHFISIRRGARFHRI